jgi:glycylpeptide N-tetradecanoyltransferase
MYGTKLYGLITGIPVNLNVGKSCEINFLCVHKKLRSMRLAPVLIKEIARRVALENIYQAIYTSGTELPTPIGEPANYWSRQLNVKKLVESGYSFLSERQTIERLTRILKLPDVPTINGWRKMKVEDSEQVHSLLNEYLSKFKIYVKFSVEEVKHSFVPSDDIVSSFVVEENGQIINFASFYHLNSTINESKHKDLYAAYSYYNVPSEKYGIEDLIRNLMIEANNLGIDVFTMLNIMDNSRAITRLNFSLGTGKLRYYMYNFSLGELCNPDQIGVVMY